MYALSSNYFVAFSEKNAKFVWMEISYFSMVKLSIGHTETSRKELVYLYLSNVQTVRRNTRFNLSLTQPLFYFDVSVAGFSSISRKNNLPPPYSYVVQEFIRMYIQYTL
jgi:hypothetical protein